MRTGVLGGTFDPPHFGHLRAAELAREAMGLHRVVFVPASVPPHKLSIAVSAAHHRLAMLREAVSDHGLFDVSTLELERDGPSFTIDTLDYLAETVPNTEWVFVIGSDAFTDIRTWKQWKRIVTNYSLVLLSRPGWSVDAALGAIPDDLGLIISDSKTRAAGEVAASSPSIQVLDAPLLSISATDIRRRVKAGQSIRYLVPDGVGAYIHENRLYRD